MGSEISEEEKTKSEIRKSGLAQPESNELLKQQALAYFDKQKNLLKTNLLGHTSGKRMSEILPDHARLKIPGQNSDLFAVSPLIQSRIRSKLDPSRTAEETYQISKLKNPITQRIRKQTPGSQFAIIEKFMMDEELLLQYLCDDRFRLDVNGDVLSVENRLELIWNFLIYRYEDFSADASLDQSWNEFIKPDLQHLHRSKQVSIFTEELVICPIEARVDVVERRFGDRHQEVLVMAGNPERNHNVMQNPSDNQLYESILIEGPLDQHETMPARIEVD